MPEISKDLQAFRDIVEDVVDLALFQDQKGWGIETIFTGAHATLIISRKHAVGKLHLTMLCYEKHVDMYAEERGFPPSMNHLYMSDKIAFLQKASYLYCEVDRKYKRERSRIQESEREGA